MRGEEEERRVGGAAKHRKRARARLKERRIRGQKLLIRNRPGAQTHDLYVLNCSVT